VNQTDWKVIQWVIELLPSTLDIRQVPQTNVVSPNQSVLMVETVYIYILLNDPCYPIGSMENSAHIKTECVFLHSSKVFHNLQIFSIFWTTECVHLGFSATSTVRTIISAPPLQNAMSHTLAIGKRHSSSCIRSVAVWLTALCSGGALMIVRTVYSENDHYRLEKKKKQCGLISLVA
jgi:hypothetical protein